MQYQFEIGETEVSRTTETYRESEYDADDDPWGHLIFGLIAALVDDDRTIEHVGLTVTLFEAETNWLAYRAKGCPFCKLDHQGPSVVVAHPLETTSGVYLGERITR